MAGAIFVSVAQMNDRLARSRAKCAEEQAAFLARRGYQTAAQFWTAHGMTPT
jgi:hypothetical protein